MTAAPDTAFRTEVVNPLLAGLGATVAPPCALVVFGASGDLCRRKLLPALARLAARHVMSGAFSVVGVARTEWDDADFAHLAEDALAGGGALGAPGDNGNLVAGFRYVAGDYAQDETFERLAAVLDDLDRTRGTEGNRLYYLAVPPTAFPVVVNGLGRHGLNRPPPAWPGAFVRLVVEKPFGRDRSTAEALDREVHAAFDERQVFRIDHYLGKDTVQNVLALRFANSLFESTWNRRYIDMLQVTVAETGGVETRGAFYEETGALRDIVQNHVLQVFALVLMEPPAGADADAVRDEKVKALRAVAPPAPDDLATQTVRAQYGPGLVDGLAVRGYRQEPGVPPDSTTETFVAVRLHVENWRWAGVPIYVRTGKRLPKRVSEVAIQYQRPPHVPFGPGHVHDHEADVLVIRIHPDDGVAITFGAKAPGRGFEVRRASMEFLYESAFPGEALGPYERLLLDALVGDPTLFLRSDEVAEAWRIVDPIEQAWAEGRPPLVTYPAGTWGPEEAEELVRRDGRRWHQP